MSIDRLERRLPEVLTELSLPVMPDYVDNLLLRTERMPQRPGWSFPERWFPVSTITATLSARRPASLRPLMILAVVAALVAGALLLYVGSQNRLPPPFGLARNGVVVTTNASGDLVAIDPATDAPRTILAGPDLCCAQISGDGQRIAVLDLPSPDADPTRLRVIRLDGSVIRELPAADLRGLTDFAWAWDGRRLLLTFATQPKVLDIETGILTTIEVPGRVAQASWIGSTGDVLLGYRISDAVFRIERVTPGATTGATPVKELAYAVDVPKVLYFVWGTEPGQQGRLHVFDFATLNDVEVSPSQETGTPRENQWENPVWSPDATHIAAELYTVGENHVAVIPASGGDPVIVGPAFPEMTNGTVIRFSPDGASLLVTYRFNSSTWLLPISGTPGRQIGWATAEDIDWQRLAP
jgi:hypothetical protein